MSDRSNIRLRPPRSIGEAALWLGIGVVSVVAGYGAVLVVLVATGAWGGA